LLRKKGYRVLELYYQNYSDKKRDELMNKYAIIYEKKPNRASSIKNS
jgi:hypothetical protein